MSSHLNLYEHLADELGGLIAGRVFAPGDRLPSIRHLARQKKLSVSTVMQAFRLLEDRGLVDARPQAGFYVRRRARVLDTVAGPATLHEPTYVGINSLLMRVMTDNETHGVVKMGSAWPGPDLLPGPRIQRIVSSVARRHPDYLTRVSCVPNEPEFVRQVQRRALDWGKIDVSEMVVTSSCTEAIALCLRAVAKPGDTIAIESSTFFVLLQLIESMGMKALEIPIHARTGISIDALELALRQGLVQACMFIPNVNNPLGCVMPEQNKQRLAALVARYNVPLIEDDIYSDLCFASQRPWPVKAYDTSGNVLLCSSFSKTVTPAARVGYALAGKYAQQVALLRNISGGATSYFFQAVLAEFIDGSSYDNQVRKLRRELSSRIARMSDAVSEYFPSECSMSEPQGGLVLWVEMPAAVDSLVLYRKALARGIAFVPGALFSASGNLRNCMRLSCANAWGSEMDAAVRTLGELVHAELP